MEKEYDIILNCRKAGVNIKGTNKVVVPPFYDNVMFLKDDYFKVKDGRLFGYYNGSNQITDIMFEEARDFYQGFAMVRIADGHYGFINKEGELQDISRLSYATNFKPDGYATVGCLDSPYLLDTKMKLHRLKVKNGIAYRETPDGYVKYMDAEKAGVVESAYPLHGKILDQKRRRKEEEAQQKRTEDIALNLAEVVNYKVKVDKDTLHIYIKNYKKTSRSEFQDAWNLVQDLICDIDNRIYKNCEEIDAVIIHSREDTNFTRELVNALGQEGANASWEKNSRVENILYSSRQK